MFGRKKSLAKPEAQTEGQEFERPPGEPMLAGGRVAPEESVLDELSRAFGVETVDDNADLIGDDDADDADDADGADGADGDGDGDGDEVSDDESDDLRIVTADSVGPAGGVESTPTPPVERATIKIGGDFGDAMVNTVPLRESIGSSDASGPATTAQPTRSTVPILGGDDDLPDAVYLDSVADDDSGTVFIDDDGTGDALVVKESTMPGIEPRLRQRRIGVRRAASRKRIKWVLIGALGFTLVLGVLTLLGSGWFAIEDIQVSGAERTDENRLQVVIDELDGTPVLLADTQAAEQDLEAIPWVEDARVRTQFPNSATIEIRERTAVAAMAGVDGRFRVLDAKGRVLDIVEGQPEAYVLIGGPTTLDFAAGEFAPVGPSWAAALVPKLTPTIRPRVTLIEVTADGADLLMYLAPDPSTEQTSPIQVRFGSAVGDAEQIEKLVRLEDRLDDVSASSITEINVSTNEVTDQ